MVEDKEVRDYLLRACNFLIKDQNDDGSWRMRQEDLKAPPPPYNRSLILTSQALQSLIFNVKPKYVESIKKALNFCMNKKLNHESSIDLLAWKLSALNFSNISRSERIKGKIIEILEEKQEDRGSWPYYPHTFTLTNYSVCEAISKDFSEKVIDKTIAWFNNSKKEKGWSKDGKTNNIEPSFTANAVISLVKLGEKPSKEVLKYLESSQKENGGWEVLSDSDKWENVTSYSTALCTLALILMKGDRNKIEKGINFLLKCQDKEGKILRAPNEKETYHYLFYYVIKTLAFYLDSKNNLGLNKFYEEKKRGFLFSCYKNILKSRALGVTQKARRRRIDVLKALEEGNKEVAEIIDFLKYEKGYAHLNKKSHITQVKSDAEYLRSIKVIGKEGNKYFTSIDLL